jgi:hypothetical protein
MVDAALAQTKAMQSRIRDLDQAARLQDPSGQDDLPNFYQSITETRRGCHDNRVPAADLGLHNRAFRPNS